MSEEEFDQHFLEITRRIMEPWAVFKTDLVKQPGYSESQEKLYFDAFYAGVAVAHTLMAREIFALYSDS